MSFKNYSAFAFLAATAWLSGCGTKATNPGGAGGGSGADACTQIAAGSIDVSTLDPAPVSLKNDVFPIFGLSCIQSDCHNHYSTGASLQAGLDLGPKCAYNAADSKCEFPATPPAQDPNALDPMVDQAQPLTPDIAAAVVQNLVKTQAKTVVSPTVARVVPGDPGHSFLVLKLSNTQGNFPQFQCMNTDPSQDGAGGAAPPCGVGMPLNKAPPPASLCDTPGGGAAEFDLIVRWIAQGAMNDVQ